MQDGWTPLLNAAGEGVAKMVELLLSKGASVDAATNVSTWYSVSTYLSSVNLGVCKVARVMAVRGHQAIALASPCNACGL
jgi:hypothetical protein